MDFSVLVDQPRYEILSVEDTTKLQGQFVAG